MTAVTQISLLWTSALYRSSTLGCRWFFYLQDSVLDDPRAVFCVDSTLPLGSGHLYVLFLLTAPGQSGDALAHAHTPDSVSLGLKLLGTLSRLSSPWFPGIQLSTCARGTLSHLSYVSWNFHLAWDDEGSTLPPVNCEPEGMHFPRNPHSLSPSLRLPLFIFAPSTLRGSRGTDHPLCQFHFGVPLKQTQSSTIWNVFVSCFIGFYPKSLKSLYFWEKHGGENYTLQFLLHENFEDENTKHVDRERRNSESTKGLCAESIRNF